MKLLKRSDKIFWIILILVTLILITPWGRAGAKTLMIMPEFIPDSSFSPLNFLTAKPQITEVKFMSQDRTIYADLWAPRGKNKHPAVILHLGVNIDRKDSRVLEIANALSRSGIAVLAPNIPSLGKHRVLAEAKDDLVTSFEYLKSQPNIKNAEVGFIGFCASGGLVILASEDPKIADDVKFLVAVNPYYDLSTLYENITLRQTKSNGTTENWNPDAKTVEIYNRETINLLDAKSDREILNSHLSLIEPELIEKGQFLALSQEELNQLSADGKLTYDTLTNKDANKVSFYLENATSAQKNFLKEVSPSTNIGNLKAKALILMDKNNIYIPYTEAESLDKALAQKDHLFVETQILPAGNLSASLPLKNYPFETVKLFRFVYELMLESN